MIVRPVIVLLSIGLFLILLQLPRIEGETPKINRKGLLDEINYNAQQTARDREVFESLDNAVLYEELSDQRNVQALDTFVEDYANNIDDVLLDKSVVGKTMKRANMAKEYDNQIIKEGPCACNSRIEREFLGDNVFPRIVETKVCGENQPHACKPPYVCSESKYNLKILKWKTTMDQGSLELPIDLGKDWIIEIKPISVGCMCLRNYQAKI